MFVLQRNRQKGLTLIELMISLALGLALTAGAISVFQQNKQTFYLQESVARLQETGRYAMNIMARDIRNTGYRGCRSRLAGSNNGFIDSQHRFNVLQTWSPASIAEDFSDGISGYDYSPGDTNWTPALDAVISAESPISGTDVIVLRPIKGCNRVVNSMTGCAADQGTGAINVNASVDGCIAPHDVAIVSNCKSASIFVITNDPTNSIEHLVGSDDASDSRTVRHADDLGNDQNLSACFGGTPDPDGSTLSRMTNVIYYIADSGADDEIPALFRMVNGGTPVELLEAVEDMQILYGEDTVDDDNFVVTNFVPADNVSNWSNVLAVRLTLVMQTLKDDVIPSGHTFYYDRDGDDSINTDADSDDEYKAEDAGDGLVRLRKVFSTTVALRNRMS